LILSSAKVTIVNIYLIIILFLYVFFVTLFPLFNKINSWIDIEMGTLYFGSILTIVNIFIVFNIAKVIKLKLKGRLGKGMITGILHTPEPITFAGKSNLIYAQSTIMFYNNKSESVVSFLMSRSTKDPYDHFEPFKEITLFAKDIFFNYQGQDIPFTSKFKNLINPYAASDGRAGKTTAKLSYSAMKGLVESGQMGNIMVEAIDAVSTYQKDGKSHINYNTEFLLFTRYIFSDKQKDLLIGLDENLNPDINAFRHAVEDNVENKYLSSLAITAILPPLWIALITFFLLGQNSFNFSENLNLYLYGTFFQIPFYYFLGWKYIAHYNKTSFFN